MEFYVLEGIPEADLDHCGTQTFLRVLLLSPQIVRKVPGIEPGSLQKAASLRRTNTVRLINLLPD